jgi:hypothetical protein
MTEWKDISTAPKDGTVFLVCGYGGNGYYVTDAKFENKEIRMFDQESDKYLWDSTYHTHWQPLPPPPDSSK